MNNNYLHKIFCLNTVMDAQTTMFFCLSYDLTHEWESCWKKFLFFGTLIAQVTSGYPSDEGSKFWMLF